MAVSDAYVLRFDGPVPAYSWHHNLAVGIKARTKARSKGYHVTLTKGAVNAEEANRRGDGQPSLTFADRLRNKFRRGYSG